MIMHVPKKATAEYTTDEEEMAALLLVRDLLFPFKGRHSVLGIAVMVGGG